MTVGTQAAKTRPDPTRPNPAMTVGVNVSPDDYGTWFGKFKTPPADTRVFTPPGKGILPLNAAPITKLPAGCYPWISHKDEVPVKDVGAYSTRLIAQVKPTGRRKLKWTFRHEGEDYDHKKYIAYWRDLRRMWNDHPQRDKIELINIHTLYPSRWKAQATEWRRWMLPDIAHIEGWDCYPPLAFASYEPPQSLFGLPVGAAREFGTPYCIPEFGTGLRAGDKGKDRAKWFTECINILAERGCRSVGMWCSKETLGGKFVDYRPHDAETLAAWNSALTRYRPK